MEAKAVIERLSGNRPQLEAMGLRRLSLFGSTARGEAGAGSDVDLAVMLDKSATIDLFRFAAIGEHLSQLIGAPVDMVVEPCLNPRVQTEIDRDRLRVY